MHIYTLTCNTYTKNSLTPASAAILLFSPFVSPRVICISALCLILTGDVDFLKLQSFVTSLGYPLSVFNKNSTLSRSVACVSVDCVVSCQ